MYSLDLLGGYRGCNSSLRSLTIKIVTTTLTYLLAETATVYP